MGKSLLMRMKNKMRKMAVIKRYVWMMLKRMNYLEDFVRFVKSQNVPYIAIVFVSVRFILNAEKSLNNNRFKILIIIQEN